MRKLASRNRFVQFRTNLQANIRAAAENRVNPETSIIARTDAREVFDLDEALRRGERYIRAGADGLRLFGARSDHLLEVSTMLYGLR